MSLIKPPEQNQNAAPAAAAEPVRIVPTIGRVMWYWPNRDAVTTPGAQPNDCHVCYVHGEGSLVNIAGFDCNGQHFALTSVPVAQEGDVPPEHGGFVVWMPYQRQQAAK